MSDRQPSYIAKAPFEAAIAAVGILTCVAYLIDPAALERSAIGHTARVLLVYWVALYAVGGVLILAGLLTRSVRLELAGLCAFATALAINATSIVHFAGAQGLVSAGTFAALGCACCARGRFLYSAWRRQRHVVDRQC